MRQQGGSGSAASSRWLYVLIGALGIAAIVLVGGLVYNGYQVLVAQTPTPQAIAATSPTATKPWPTVATVAPTFTRPPSATPRPTSTATPTPRPTNTRTPSPTPTPTPILIDIQELGKMVTIQYKLQTVSVVEEKEENWVKRLFGENKLVLVATGEVMAGVDMALVKDQDIVVDGTTVMLTMPPAQIISVQLIPGESWVYDRKLNLLAPNWQQELQAEEQAERSLEGWSIGHGILGQAEETFRLRLESFLRSLGFTNVTIIFRRSE